MAADREWREEAIRNRPVLGRVASAITPKVVAGPESQSTAAWKTGADGELAVAAVLERSPGAAVLHDRRIPGTKGNIDHIAVAPSGVYVIDAKRYRGTVTTRDRGSFFRPDVRLLVGGRDRTKLVEGVLRQVDVVAKAASGAGFEGVSVHGVLCFVGADWPLIGGPPVVLGVTALWPKRLTKLLDAPGPLAPDRVDALAELLARKLPAA